MTAHQHPRAVYLAGLEHGANPIPAAARRGPLLATSNVFGRDRSDGSRPESVVDELRLAFENLDAILDAAGMSSRDIAKVDVRLATDSVRTLLNEQWSAYFADPDDRPARHVTVGDLPADFRVQLSVLACAG